MSRLSERISQVWSTVECPRCGNHVHPEQGLGPEPTTDEIPTRQSFIWLAPRGDFCPHCQFPLSKYFGRLKWIRTAGIGVGIVVLAFVAQFIAVMQFMGNEIVGQLKYVIAFGAVVSLVGVAGIIIGPRH